MDFGLAGLTDPNVRFLKPACGTGTYLLALAEEAFADSAGGRRAHWVGAQGSVRAARRRVRGLARPGGGRSSAPRVVVEGHGATLTRRLPVFTSNVLTPPAAGTAGRQATDRAKPERPILVVFGNPPWGDRTRDSATARTEAYAYHGCEAAASTSSTRSPAGLYRHRKP